MVSAKADVLIYYVSSTFPGLSLCRISELLKYFSSTFPTLCQGDVNVNVLGAK